MRQWMSVFFNTEDCGCCCGCGSHEEEQKTDCDCGDCHDEDPVIEIVDPETGETFSFYYADEFEYNEEDYCVLVTLDEEDPHYVIGKVIEDESGESYIETLDEDDCEEVYEAYEDLLEEYFDEEEELADAADDDEDDDDDDDDDDEDEEATEVDN